MRITYSHFSLSESSDKEIHSFIIQPVFTSAHKSSTTTIISQHLKTKLGFKPEVHRLV
jgi:hypothetical protein